MGRVFDLHCHSREGSIDGIVKIQDTINRLKLLGYDGMLITDHNSYMGYDSLKELPKDFIVLKGIEYDSLDAGHLIIVLPTDCTYRMFEYRGMQVNDIIDIVHGFGGIVGPAHPYFCYKLGIGHTKYKDDLELLGKFDFIETLNGSLHELGTKKAFKLAERLDKPCFSGSDSHTIDSVGYGKTIFPKEVYTEDDLIELVKASDYNSFVIAGELKPRKIESFHKLCVGVGGFAYSLLNRPFAGRYDKRARMIIDSMKLNRTKK